MKILIGPILRDEGELGRFEEHPDIKPFYLPRNQLEDEFGLLKPDITFEELYHQLTIDFKPDVFIWWEVTIHKIPPGIEKCPCFSIGVAGDWYLGFSILLSYSRAFDVILGDRYLIHLLKKAGVENCEYWPRFALNPERFKILDNVKRIYDVTFIGSLDESIHPRRMQLLQHINTLKNKYNILISDEIYGDEYVQALNQSKIVFNYSVCGVMNLRAYQAPACGALLFIEDTNKEIEHYLKPSQSCIVYNEGNLVKKIKKLLTFDEVREEAALKGNSEIQNFTYEAKFSKLIQSLNIYKSKYNSKSREFIKENPLDDWLTVFKQLYYTNPISAYYFCRKEFSGIYSHKILNASGVLAFHLLLKKNNQTRENLLYAKELVELAIKKEMNPIYLYNLSSIHLLLEEREQALKYLNQALKLLTKPLMPYWWNELIFWGRDNPLRLLVKWEKIAYQYSQNIQKMDFSYKRLLTQRIQYLTKYC